MKYDRNGDGDVTNPPTIPEYEARLLRAHDAHDEDAIADIMQEYTKARADKVKRDESKDDNNDGDNGSPSRSSRSSSSRARSSSRPRSSAQRAQGTAAGTGQSNPSAKTGGDSK